MTSAKILKAKENSILFLEDCINKMLDQLGEEYPLSESNYTIPVPERHREFISYKAVQSMHGLSLSLRK